MITRGTRCVVTSQALERVGERREEPEDKQTWESGRSYAPKGTSLACLMDTARLGSYVIVWLEQWRSIECSVACSLEAYLTRIGLLQVTRQTYDHQGDLEVRITCSADFARKMVGLCSEGMERKQVKRFCGVEGAKYVK